MFDGRPARKRVQKKFYSYFFLHTSPRRLRSRFAPCFNKLIPFVLHYRRFGCLTVSRSLRKYRFPRRGPERPKFRRGNNGTLKRVIDNSNGPRQPSAYRSYRAI